MNKVLQTIIVLPLTTSFKDWPTRVNILINKTQSQVCIEHIRSVAKERFIEKLGKSSEIEMASVRKKITAVFVQ